MTAPRPRLRTEAGVAGWQALLADPGSALLALDFDGTLAPIVDDPTAARALPGVAPTLARLSGVLGTVAILTGRPARTAAQYGGFAGVPGLERLVILGQYGRERWDGSTGEVRGAPSPPGLPVVRAALYDVLGKAGVAGAYVEDKGAALAVHVRRLPHPEEAMIRLRQPLIELAGRAGLIVEPGRMVLELRPPGIDKGSALRSLVSEVAARAAVYAGDDLGDLAAFDAMDALRAHGLAGLLVCAASTEVGAALAERADLVVSGPAGVLGWLAELADRLDRPG